MTWCSGRRRPTDSLAKAGSALDIVAPAGLSVARLTVMGVGKANKLKSQDFVKLGGAAMGKVPARAEQATIFAEFSGGSLKPDQAAEIALGTQLRAYVFDRYKTKRKEGEDPPIKVRGHHRGWQFVCRSKGLEQRREEPVADGVIMARDLINEPANVLYPEEFARRTAVLKKLGIVVEVLDVPAMKKLGMNALLGVGQGSRKDSRVVIMRWNGGKKSDAPVAFIGKGVMLRHRRHFDQARVRDGGHEGRHGGRGLRGRPDACARGAQGQGQRGRRHRPRREHARRQRPAPGRHRQNDERPDHRDHQHRRRRPSRAGRRAALRQHAA